MNRDMLRRRVLTYTQLLYSNFSNRAKTDLGSLSSFKSAFLGEQAIFIVCLVPVRLLLSSTAV